MKKVTFLAVAFTAMVFAACGGKKANTEVESAETKSFEQEQIEASIKMNFDSLAAEVAKLKQFPFLSEDANGKIALTTEEKQVKPDYLLDPTISEEATTLAEKYRFLSALDVDKRIAALYEIPTDGYDKAITKLAAEINDKSLQVIDDNANAFETSQALYDAMNENGRINFFWQLAAAALVEQLYVANQNTDKFLSVFDDDAAANVTFRIVLVVDAIKRLAAYDEDIQPVADAIEPLTVINAITVDEFKSQLNTAKDQINAARVALLK